ncbi:MAG TPA: haloacid dehalogenase type II [Tepidisphaeraceae bacterium]|jgi:2-haloacid dehalogenase|nr:haloacid dehalogenase type II [Tepidisphaeraceae bacterium]
MSKSFSLEPVEALTFDLFGTVLDLGGSLTPYIDQFLKQKQSNASAKDIWHEWRYRQRLEQYQDNIVAMGHSGYTPVARRAGVFVLRQFGIDATNGEVDRLMDAWQHLKPFPEVLAAFERLKKRFRLVALSNGERGYLAHLVKNQIKWDFDEVISVEDVGAFKPHPGVYRHGAFKLGLEIGQCMMVSANSFDVMGARMCGMRGAYVNRYNLPYEDTPFVADVTVRNFTELADKLLS